MKFRFFISGLIILIFSGYFIQAEDTPPKNIIKPEPISDKAIVKKDANKISLKLKNMDILEVFNILAQKGKLNIIAGNDVRGRVTLFLENVDVWKAFLKIIETNSLAYIQDGDIIRVFTDREHEVLYGEKFYNKTITEVIPLTHVQAQAILPTIEGLKSRIGKVLIDENSNAFIIVDSVSSVEKIKKTIQFIDVALSSKIFNLQFITATKIAEKVKPLLSKRGAIYIDEQTNILIVSDVESVLKLIDEIISEYDQVPKLNTEIIQLDYAKYDEIKEHIEKELTPDLGTMQVDKRTGYLIITDLPKNIERMKPIITALDEKHLEVLIDVTICAVRLRDEYTFGINWEFVLSRFQHQNLGFNIGSALSTLAETPVSDSPIRPFDVRSTKLDGNDISSFRPGGHLVFAGKMSGGKDGTGNPYQGILEAIRSLGDVDILSSPRIAVINGEEAKIQVGENEAYVTNTVVQNTSNATNAENVNFIEVGVNLKVTPHINKEGYITMEIEPEVSNVSRTLVTSSGNQIPIVRTTNAKTTIMVEDGATIILAGFIEKNFSKQHRRIPILGSIPIVGFFFKRVEDVWNNLEIVIVINPKIIQGNEYAEELDRLLPHFEKEKSKTKIPFLDDIDRLDLLHDTTGQMLKD